jgi:hypothetical protein
MRSQPSRYGAWSQGARLGYRSTSTFAARQLLEALWLSKELWLHRLLCEQPPYHLLDRRIERELVPMAQTYGFALIPWSPLAGGFLSGKYRCGEGPPPGSRLGQHAEGKGPALHRHRLQGARGGPGPDTRARSDVQPGGARLGGAAARGHQSDHRTAHAGAARGLFGGSARPAHGRGSKAARCSGLAGAGYCPLL